MYRSPKKGVDVRVQAGLVVFKRRFCNRAALFGIQPLMGVVFEQHSFVDGSVFMRGLWRAVCLYGFGKIAEETLLVLACDPLVDHLTVCVVSHGYKFLESAHVITYSLFDVQR